MSRPRLRLAWALAIHGGRRLAWVDLAGGGLIGLLWARGPSSWPGAALQAGAVLAAASAVGLYERAAWAGGGRLASRSLGGALSATALASGLLWLADRGGPGPEIWRAVLAGGLTAAVLAGPRLAVLGGLRRRPLAVHAADRVTAARLQRAASGTAGPRVVVDRSGRSRPDLVVSGPGGPVVGGPGPGLPAAEVHAALFQAVPPETVTEDWLARRLARADRWPRARRVADGILAAVALVVTLPLSLLAIALVAAGRDGPVFYAQARVGRDGVPFRMWKLRTMRADAEAGGPRWAAPRDPRRTPAGRLLRTLRLDELPQLVNVLRGEMALVGPRPERPELVAPLARAIPGYAWRQRVPPGLTGWAQIQQRYAAGVGDTRRKLELDLYYLAERSWRLDALVLLRTVTRLAEGAR